MFKPMKVIKGYLSWMTMLYNGLIGGFRLLGTALVRLLGGEVDFSVDGLEMLLEVELTLVLVNVNGFGGQGR